MNHGDEDRAAAIEREIADAKANFARWYTVNVSPCVTAL